MDVLNAIAIQVELRCQRCGRGATIRPHEQSLRFKARSKAKVDSASLNATFWIGRRADGDITPTVAVGVSQGCKCAPVGVEPRLCVELYIRLTELSNRSGGSV